MGAVVLVVVLVMLLCWRLIRLLVVYGWRRRGRERGGQLAKDNGEFLFSKHKAFVVDLNGIQKERTLPSGEPPPRFPLAESRVYPSCQGISRTHTN